MSRAILLMEFDDLLVRTEDRRRDALRAALAHDGVALSDELFESRCAGLTVAEAIRAACEGSAAQLDETALDLAAARAASLNAAADARGVRLLPGVAVFVLRAAGGARLGLVAATGRSEVARVLELAGLADTFDHVSCEDDGGLRLTLAERWHAVRRRLLALMSAVDGGAPVTIALCRSRAAIDAARALGVRVFAVGELAATIAFRADGWIPTLDKLSLADVLALEAHSE